ncbi:MAG TPA: YMGG-like glycine zipper-containing protein [Gemmatimonadaceae bacterium]|nr:YMGG-like glycine zipper-containing protein [Gemmatimonadaceae bacterium]
MYSLSARSLRACALGAAFLGAAACSDKSANARAQADSELARDLALAGAQPTQPTAFTDTSVAPTPSPASKATQGPPATQHTHTSRKPKVETPPPRPVKQVAQAPEQSPPTPVQQAPQPAPAPAAAPAPAPSPAMIGSGTGFGLTSGSKVCTSNLPGDKLIATVNDAVTGSNGAVIPAGSTVVLEVASVTPGENGQDAQIAFRVRSIEVNGKDYRADATVTPSAGLEKTKVDNPDPNADKKKVIGGAIAGAILGQIIGHNTKGTVIGAAAGAATGAAVAHAGQKYQACLPAGAPMHLTLNSAIVM